MKKFLGALIILFALNISAASAEIITVEGTGRYYMNLGIKQTIDDACEIAYTGALRNAAEHAGVALESHALMKDFELKEYSVETAVGAVLEIIGEPIYTNGDTNGKTFEIVCNIKARVDTAKVEDFLGKKDLLAEREAKDKRIKELEAEL